MDGVCPITGEASTLLDEHPQHLASDIIHIGWLILIPRLPPAVRGNEKYHCRVCRGGGGGGAWERGYRMATQQHDVVAYTDHER